MKKNILLVLLLAMSLTLFSQDAETEESDGIGMGIGLSNQTIDNENYTSIALMPELDLGFFGIGLNVDLRFKLDIDSTDSENPKPEFQIYEDDWVIDGGGLQEYLSLYLSKFAYIRLGHKNEDFYLKAGQFDRATLGNGTILSDYSNMQFMPETRLSGLALDIDGNLFNFPYIGFESFIGNVAVMDVIGGRFYTRPFSALSIPVISNIEIAATGVIDRAPYYYSLKLDTVDSVITEVDADDDDQVMMYGFDVTIPFVDTPLFSMDVYGDIVIQNKSGAQIYGLGGKIISLVDYKIQYINQQKNYVVDYFNASYDLNRTGSNFDIYHNNEGFVEIDAKQDMNATLGFQIPGLLYFDAKLSGILTMFEDNPNKLSAHDAPQLYPSLKGTAHLDNEMLKIVSADFFYLKNGMDTLESIVDPTNALIGGTLNYHSGNMIISFIVDVKYNGDAYNNYVGVDESLRPDEWLTNTQLAVNFQL